MKAACQDGQAESLVCSPFPSWQSPSFQFPRLPSLWSQVAWAEAVWGCGEAHGPGCLTI